MKQFFTSIVAVFILGTSYSQAIIKIQIDGDTFKVFNTIYPVNVRVDPPPSLEDGHWVAYYSDSSIAFKGFYTRGKLEGTFCIYHENRIHEMFFFKNGEPIWCKEYWWYSGPNHYNKSKWRLKSKLTIDSTRKTLSCETYNRHGRLIIKDIYQFSEEFGPPFIRIYEETGEFLRESFYFTYWIFGIRIRTEKKVYN